MNAAMWFHCGLVPKQKNAKMMKTTSVIASWVSLSW